MRSILKDVEIKIPALYVIISGLIIAAIIVVTTIVIIKNREIKDIKSDYSQSVGKYREILKTKSDSIETYKNLIKDNSYLILEQKTLISILNNRISSIKPRVEEYTPNQVFDSIQAYIEPKNDSLKFKFSGNQIKQIYREHLELLESRSGMIQYEQLVSDMNKGTTLLTCQLNKQSEMQAITQELLDKCEKDNAELQKNLTKETKNKKFWKISTPISGVTGLVMGILLVR